MRRTEFTPTGRPLRLGMVGGGPGAFIGPVHRMAAELDGEIRLVAGAFSRDPDRSRAAGAAHGLDPDRVYDDYAAMIAAEAARPDGVDLIAIVTPNHLHFPVAKAALEAGLHVICDKPATLTLAEALELRRIVRASRGQFGLTYVYAGYPMVREARERVRRGDLGRVRKVVVEYSQGWLSRPVGPAQNRQAAWRADPAQAGQGGCVADIGVHAVHLAEFVSGLRLESVCAQLSRLVPGRALDDDCNALLSFEGGAVGALVASQAASGDRNGLRLRVYGDEAGLAWSHAEPQILTIDAPDRPGEVLHAGAPYLTDAGRGASRLPTGHPEGFIEAFANLYRDFAASIRGQPPRPGADTPDIEAGVRGMAFIEAAVRSSGRGWVSLAGRASPEGAD